MEAYKIYILSSIYSNEALLECSFDFLFSAIDFLICSDSWSVFSSMILDVVDVLLCRETVVNVHISGILLFIAI